MKEEMRCPCCGEKLTLQMLFTLAKSLEEDSEPEGVTPHVLVKPEPEVKPLEGRFIWNHIARLVDTYGWKHLENDPTRNEWRDFQGSFASFYSSSDRLNFIAQRAGLKTYELPAGSTTSIRAGKILDELSRRGMVEELFRAILQDCNKEDLVP